MLATALWLVSLTVTFYGERSWWLGVFLVFTSAAAWTFGTFVQRGTKHRLLASIVTLALLGTGYAWALDSQLRWRTVVSVSEQGPNPPHAPEGYAWKRWSPEAIAKARSEGRPVVVDFTAKWCLTCNVSVKPAFESKAVIDQLTAMNALALVADYTSYPPEISAELERFGRNGVPLVVVYPGRRQPTAACPARALPYPAPYSPTILDALNKAAR
jgi:thiol:disulfide interchange protein